MKSNNPEDYLAKAAFASAYSSPSSGSLESVMGNSTDSSASSPTPPPSHAEQHNVTRYMDNLKYAWSFTNDMAAGGRHHKIAHSPSFDVFCTDRLCSRRSRSPKHGNSVFQLGCVVYVAFALIGIAEFILLALTAYAFHYCYHHDGNWDIGVAIVGVTIVHSLFAGVFVFGLLQRRLKFLLPLTFHSILIFVAGCGTFFVVLFTSFDEKISKAEQVEHKVFCALLGTLVVHQLLSLVVSVRICRRLKHL